MCKHPDSTSVGLGGTLDGVQRLLCVVVLAAACLLLFLQSSAQSSNIHGQVLKGSKSGALPALPRAEAGDVTSAQPRMQRHC